MVPKISVIIPAHQEEEQISETLDSCINQTFKDFNIYVVANGCTDNTVKIAKRFDSKIPLFIIETNNKGIGYACNLGANKSNGDIVVILDADTILSENSLDEISKAVEDEYVGGTLAMKTKEKNFQYKLLGYLNRIGSGGGWGPVRFCTREIYEKINGHREDADFAVDCDFAKRVKSKGKTKFISKAHYLTSMRRFEKKKFELLKQSVQYVFYIVFYENNYAIYQI